MSRALARTAALALLAVAAAENLRHDLKEFLEPFGDEVHANRLRICNAYPYQTPMDISFGSPGVGVQRLAYKECREYTQESLDYGDIFQLKRKNKILFNVVPAEGGPQGHYGSDFVISDLPNKDSVLLLVAHRQDAEGTAVAFESHVFSNLLNSQIAVINTYRGAGQATLRIQDLEDASTDRSEVLQYDNVAAVNAGSYEIALVSSDGKLKEREKLEARNRESYAVIRCGVEPKEGKSYPEEIMIYPMPEKLKSSGSRSHVLNAVMLGLAVLGFVAN